MLFLLDSLYSIAKNNEKVKLKGACKRREFLDICAIGRKFSSAEHFCLSPYAFYNQPNDKRRYADSADDPADPDSVFCRPSARTVYIRTWGIPRFPSPSAFAAVYLLRHGHAARSVYGVRLRNPRIPLLLRRGIFLFFCIVSVLLQRSGRLRFRLFRLKRPHRLVHFGDDALFFRFSLRSRQFLFRHGIPSRFLLFSF